MNIENIQKKYIINIENFQKIYIKYIDKKIEIQYNNIIEMKYKISRNKKYLKIYIKNYENGGIYYE